jgi:hypothetical protein
VGGTWRRAGVPGTLRDGRDNGRALEREHLLRELCGEGSFGGIQKDLVRRAQGTVMSVSLGILRDS